MTETRGRSVAASQRAAGREGGRPWRHLRYPAESRASRRSTDRRRRPRHCRRFVLSAGGTYSIHPPACREREVRGRTRGPLLGLRHSAPYPWYLGSATGKRGILLLWVACIWPRKRRHPTLTPHTGSSRHRGGEKKERRGQQLSPCRCDIAVSRIRRKARALRAWRTCLRSALTSPRFLPFLALEQLLI